MRNHRYVHGRGKDLEGGALAMDIQGIREGALFAMHNMQDIWSFPLYRVFLLAGMPACYIYRQQEGRQAELPKGRRDFKMATLDVTEKVNVLVDAIGWEGFCEELMARMDEDALDAVCDRIAPRYGVELAGSRYAA